MLIISSLITFFLFCLTVIQLLQYVEMLEIRKFNYKQFDEERINRKEYIERMEKIKCQK